MRTAIRLLSAALLVAPVFAADPPDFRLWKADELAKRDAALSKQVGPDHSARETLADFGDHRVRFLHRNADGFPEQHDNIVDLVYVQSGAGTLQLGGTVIDKRAGGGPGEYAGSRLEGGERHALSAGDVIHIPAKVPHAFLVPKGGHITYVLVKFPGQ